MQIDREAMPSRAEPYTSIAELNATIANPDRVERSLQVARWICQHKAAYGPKHADAWQEPRDAAAWAKHRNAVAFVELQNAGTLAMLCETIEALQAEIDSDSPERAAKRNTALTHLLAIVGGPWRVSDATLQDRGDGVSKPYESWRAWARRVCRLPECYPPKGWEPPKHAPAVQEQDQGSYRRARSWAQRGGQ